MKWTKKQCSKMTPAGLEPAIPGSVGRCLIHWATGPVDNCQLFLHLTTNPLGKFTMLNNLCDFQQPSFLVGGQSWLLVFEIGGFEQGLLLSTFC